MYGAMCVWAMLVDSTAYAALYACQPPEGSLVLQAIPCAKGSAQRARVDDGEALPSNPVKPAKKSAGSDNRRQSSQPTSAATPVKGMRNKTIICQLLAVEKTDAQAQINGSQAVPAGESPRDNLAKIERQQQRVGCEAS